MNVLNTSLKVQICLQPLVLELYVIRIIEHKLLKRVEDASANCNKITIINKKENEDSSNLDLRLNYEIDENRPIEDLEEGLIEYMQDILSDMFVHIKVL